MNTIEQLIDKRDKLVIERDRIQKEITDIWNILKDEFLKEAIKLGLFTSKWLYSEDISSYSYRSQILCLEDLKLKDKICELGKMYADRFYSNTEGWNISLPHNGYNDRFVMRFEHNCEPSDIVKKYNMNVDFSYLDSNIKEMEAKKKIFYK